MKKTIIAAAVILALTGCEENKNLTPEERLAQDIAYKAENLEEYASIVVLKYASLLSDASYDDKGEKIKKNTAKYKRLLNLYLDEWGTKDELIHRCALKDAENRLFIKYINAVREEQLPNITPCDIKDQNTWALTTPFENGKWVFIPHESWRPQSSFYHRIVIIRNYRKHKTLFN